MAGIEKVGDIAGGFSTGIAGQTGNITCAFTWLIIIIIGITLLYKLGPIFGGLIGRLGDR